MYKFLLIIVMCLFIILLYFDKKIPEYFENYPEQIMTKSYLSNDKVPKIIWTYWDTEEVPEIVKLSMKSWRKTSPNYFINLMNQKNIEEFVSLPENWKRLPSYRQSDIIRLRLLEKYGGVWIDASTILLEDLDNFISKDNLTLFITPSSSLENPVFENWFISAPLNNKVIKMWIEEVLLALQNTNKYIHDSNVYNVEITGDVNYLICHLSLKNIYENDKSLLNGTKIYVSNDTAFYYQHNTPDLKYLFKNKLDKSKLMIKLTSLHRKYIDLQYFDKSLIE